MKRVLVAYYSFSGNTRALAERIAEGVSGTLLGIQPEIPYSFKYNTAVKAARAETARGFCPKLVGGNESIDAYDVVFIGSPNWFRTVAPPVLAFLRGHSFAGKAVVPFCTHGGGGLGEMERRMAEECPGAKLLPGFAAMDAVSAQMEEWLSAIGPALKG